ncbi:NRDE family protein [Psychrobacter frigidicola]|uniref:NRDE family protein n=1 Tax=Psychrobacter frigidicola TaxID=45611 RepID=A0A5C7A150_9GAMM|nr:NRDE family protein [Psychrobacter frigidicola]TXD96166.1 NRDE family protein [Psychrobacter frigidicola]
MCIVAITWQLFDELPLVLLSNRDEFLQRPTEPLHQWLDKPIYAGRDSQSGGTWLGIHQQQQRIQLEAQPKTQASNLKYDEQNGRWAAVLNFRDGVQATVSERSRGELVTDFLTSDISPMAFAREINLQDYAGFNLIIGDAKQAVIVNNRGYAPTPLYAGLHVFSNGQPDESWFKTERLRARLRQEVLPLIGENSHFDYWQPAAFDVLSDNTKAPPDKLPQTGVANNIEQALSSVYIEPMALATLNLNLKTSMPTYGTRTQSILTLRNEKGSGSHAKMRAELISRELNNAS